MTLADELYIRGYSPLDEIVFFADFNKGLHGWVPHDVAGIWSGLRVPPMLSTIVTQRFGSTGSLHGMYSLKVATRPIYGFLNLVIKRLTWKLRGLVSFEMIFTYKVGWKAPGNPGEEADFRSFQLHFDIQDDVYRYWPAIRYYNHGDGVFYMKWQYNRGGIDPISVWTDVPAGYQRLCWNMPVTWGSTWFKYNWHYLRLLLDTRNRGYVSLQCNDMIFPMGGLAPTMVDASTWPELRGLFNILLGVETDDNVRSFLFVDSMVLSAEELE